MEENGEAQDGEDGARARLTQVLDILIGSQSKRADLRHSLLETGTQSLVHYDAIRGDGGQEDKPVGDVGPVSLKGYPRERVLSGCGDQDKMTEVQTESQ